MIYFDNAATAKVDPKVLETYVKLVNELIGNPASAHGLGLKSLNYLEKARKQVSRTLKLKDKEIIFTSGASESNNLGIRGYAVRNQKLGKHLITSNVEHPSVLRVFQELEKEGFEVTYLPVDINGQIDLNQLKSTLRKDTILVSLMAVNNETGAIFPVEQIHKIIKENSNAVFMSDLTQAIGKVELDLNLTDMFSMSAHKVRGLKSSGLFVYNSNLNVSPLILGGGQEMGMRSGTDNVPLDCALATALRLYANSFQDRYDHADKLKKYLLDELIKLGPDQIKFISPKENCSPFILNFSLLHYKASVLVEALSKREVYVSTKSACSSHAKGNSYVIDALGYSPEISSNAIRLSFEGTEEIAQGKDFIKILLEEINKLERI
jgi:cysteine desulfurase